MNTPPTDRRAFHSLVQIVEALRGPEGCPWDKEQSHQTLTRFAIEEAHEFAEAVDQGDLEHVKEELGDLLLQVVLNAEIARQMGQFDIHDVIQSISDKMVRRHPHVFGDQKLESSEQVLSQWSDIKAQEKGAQLQNGFGLPPDLPALMTAQKIGEKTRKADFDFANIEEAFKKVEEEVGEFAAAQTPQEREAELGDIFFAAAQLARFINADAERCARQSNRRFEKRFFKMQELAKGEFRALSASEKETLWEAAKKATQ